MIFNNMLGLTMSSVSGGIGDDEMVFTSTCGKVFRFLHYQDCCERVCINDICGDLEDLVGAPLLVAEEASNMAAPKPEFTPNYIAHSKYEYDYYTWTFYRFATMKGAITVRWLGESNGYYSEKVDYEEGFTKKVKYG